jgi:hypothetical protein
VRLADTVCVFLGLGFAIFEWTEFVVNGRRDDLNQRIAAGVSACQTLSRAARYRRCVPPADIELLAKKDLIKYRLVAAAVPQPDSAADHSHFVKKYCSVELTLSALGPSMHGPTRWAYLNCKERN